MTRQSSSTFGALLPRQPALFLVIEQNCLATSRQRLVICVLDSSQHVTIARRCLASEEKRLSNDAGSLASSPQRFVIAPENREVDRRRVRIDAGRTDGTVSEIEAQQQRVVIGAAERHRGVAVGVTLRILLVGVDVPLGGAAQLLRQ